MSEDKAGATQRMGDQPARELRTGRTVPDDLAAPPLTLGHRFGTPQVPPNSDATMVYTLFTISVAAKANAGRVVPINLCLVLDQSLSMRGEKMERLKDAAGYVVDRLGPQDSLAVVSFNDRATLVVPAGPVQDHGLLHDAIDGITPRGGTELAAGIRTGLDQLRGRSAQRNTISALLVFTDGRTYGDEAKCMELAETARRQQIQITPLGVGAEWNEDLLEALAYRSGSHSEYIDQPNAIITAFQNHIEALQATYARSTQLAVRLAPGVRLAQLHRTRPLLGRVEVLPGVGQVQQSFALGDLHAGEEQEFLLEMVAPTGAPGPVPLAGLQLIYESATGLGQVRVPYDLHILAAQDSTHDLDPLVKTAVEKVVAYKLQQRAWQDLSDGNVQAATQRLRMVATRLIAAGEEELARTVREEADHLERTGTVSASGTKQIKYGTRGLGRTQTMRAHSGLLARETTT